MVTRSHWVLARIWQYDTYHDTWATIRYIAIHCDSIETTIEEENAHVVLRQYDT